MPTGQERQPHQVRLTFYFPTISFYFFLHYLLSHVFAILFDRMKITRVFPSSATKAGDFEISSPLSTQVTNIYDLYMLQKKKCYIYF